MDQPRSQILFILGPSGSGKSRLGEWIAADFLFLHLEIDRYPVGDGIDLASLRTQWDAFLNHESAGPLAEELGSRALSAGRPGIVLTFPGNLVLSVPLINAAERAGINVAIQYGTGADCLDAFIKREAESGRGLPVDHWIVFNHHSYAQLSRPEYAPWRLSTFESGTPRLRTALVDEIRRRLIGRL